MITVRCVPPDGRNFFFSFLFFFYVKLDMMKNATGGNIEKKTKKDVIYITSTSPDKQRFVVATEESLRLQANSSVTPETEGGAQTQEAFRRAAQTFEIHGGPRWMARERGEKKPMIGRWRRKDEQQRKLWMESGEEANGGFFGGFGG